VHALYGGTLRNSAYLYIHVCSFKPDIACAHPRQMVGQTASRLSTIRTLSQPTSHMTASTISPLTPHTLNQYYPYFRNAHQLNFLTGLHEPSLTTPPTNHLTPPQPPGSNLCQPHSYTYGLIPFTDWSLRGNVKLQRHRRLGRPYAAGVARWS
jgi:hypothetical protein